MIKDIVFPQNNETEFLEIAGRLGIKKLYFAYDFSEFSNKNIQKKLESIENKKINFEAVFLVNQKNFGSAAKQPIALAAKSSEKDRLFIESKKVKLIYGFEESGRRDFIHQRASGLNHVLCELARKNNVAIGFSYSSITNSNKAQAAVIMGRLMQNISLCQKYKAKTVIASFSGNPYELRSYHDLASIFRFMGMDDNKINNSFSYSF